MKKIFGLRYLEKAESRKVNGGFVFPHLPRRIYDPGPTPIGGGGGGGGCNPLVGRQVKTYSKPSGGYFVGWDFVMCDGSTKDVAGRLVDHV